MARSPYNIVSADAFQTLQLDAGVLLTEFDFTNPYNRPADTAILATTTGGLNPVCEPQYEDLAEDVDNVPNNTKEYLKLTGWNCSMGFTSIKFNPDNTVWSLGAADEGTAPAGSPTGTKRIVPRANVKQSDFKDIYAAFPMADGGIYVAVLKNAISSGGLNVQSTKDGKSTNQMTLTGYVSVEDLDTVPMEFVHIPAPAPVFPVSSVAGTTAGYTAISVVYTLGTNESFKYKVGDNSVWPEVGESTASGYTAWDGEDEILAATGKIITVVVVDNAAKVVAVGHATVTANAT